MYYHHEDPLFGYYTDPQVSPFLERPRLPLNQQKVSRADKRILRDLAKTVAEICQKPEQETRRELWRKHNSLHGDRPMILCYLGNIWKDLVPESGLTSEHSLCRSIEWYMLRTKYRWDHIHDDFVFRPGFKMPPIYSFTGWGVEAAIVQSSMADGAKGLVPPIKVPEDIDKLKVPKIEVDWKSTNQNLETIQEILGDTLAVELDGISVRTSISPTLVLLRGLVPLMMDMYDRPEWVHQLADFVCVGTEILLDFVEDQGFLRLNDADEYVGTGGFGYTDELPVSGFDIGHVRTCDMWGLAESQDFPSISPSMFSEFLLQYQVRLLKRFGLTCYGCCEALDEKYHLLTQQIPNLRRVSVSPSANVAIAAEILGDEYIFSWKPDPSFLALEGFDGDQVHDYVEKTVKIARECKLEIVLKGMTTIRRQPERVEKWIEIAREIVA